MIRTLKISSSLATAALALTLACGGGGGGSSAPTANPSATKLVYTDPASGAFQLKRNASLSTDTHLVLDLVGDGSTTGAGVAFSLGVDTTHTTGWTKVAGGDPYLVENGTVLNLGSGTLILKSTSATASGTNTLTGALSQKGTAGSVALNGALARVAVDLRSGATPGSVSLSAPKAQALDSAGTIGSITVSVGSLDAQ